MRCLRALPIFQLMPAVGSPDLPVATPLLGGLPGKNERPHPFRRPACRAPHQSSCRRIYPCTQIRLGAGTRNVVSTSMAWEEADDLNDKVFPLVQPDPVCGGSSPASRSFVLAALRALHLDPGRGPQRLTRARTRPNNTK